MTVKQFKEKMAQTDNWKHWVYENYDYDNIQVKKQSLIKENQEND